MEIYLPFGKDRLKLNIARSNLAGVVEPPGNSPGCARQLVAEALAQPIGCYPLPELLANTRPKSVVIIISDVTRPIPYQYLLPPLLAILHRQGLAAEQITIVIGTGCHRPNTRAEIVAALGSEIADSYRVINHHCRRDLQTVGLLSDGTPLELNRVVAEADFKIALGAIIPHKLAGYSGGAKAILPGVAGYQTITANHRMMNQPFVNAGSWQHNPVRRQMVEAARMAKLNFIINVVTDYNNEIIAVVAGDLEQAWQQGVIYCEKSCRVTVQYQTPVVICSAGGYPRDLNIYQAIKPLQNAAMFALPGGTIILCARCQEGYGDPTFAQWLKEAASPRQLIERFEQGYVLGGHKGYVLAKIVEKYQVILVSELSKSDTDRLFMTYQANLPAALDYVAQKHTPHYQAWVIPYAGLILPEHKSING